jgi:hypothetical protein
MHENPSAGKFEAPPEPQAPGADRSGSRWLLIVLLIASGYPVASWLLSIRGRGWLSAVAAVVAFASGILHHALQRRHTDALAGQDPYSPQTHITR